MDVWLVVAGLVVDGLAIDGWLVAAGLVVDGLVDGLVVAGLVVDGLVDVWLSSWAGCQWTG